MGANSSTLDELDPVAVQEAKEFIGELLALSRRILAELRERGVIRTGNAPAGDYAELLAFRAVCPRESVC
jgi:hypothetical protein